MGQRATLLFSLIATLGYSSSVLDYMLLILVVLGLATILTSIVFYKERSSINLYYRTKKRKEKRKGYRLKLRKNAFLAALLPVSNFFEQYM